MHLVFINLNSYLVLFVRTAMIVKKQLSIFFGTVPVGLLFVKNIPFFFVFLVLLVVSGPNVSYIAVGSNVIVIMGSLLLHNLDIIYTFKICY